jgi:hypothetical protein
MAWHGRGVAWKSFGGINVGAVDEPYSAYSAQQLVRDHLAAGLERPGSPEKTNRDWTGDGQVERPDCAAPLLYTCSTSPSARHITFYIYLLCPRRRILLRCILPFRLRNHWHGGHGRSSFYDPRSLALLFFILLVPPPLHFWLTLVSLSAERRRCI